MHLSTLTAHDRSHTWLILPFLHLPFLCLDHLLPSCPPRGILLEGTAPTLGCLHGNPSNDPGRNTHSSFWIHFFLLHSLYMVLLQISLLLSQSLKRATWRIFCMCMCLPHPGGHSTLKGRHLECLSSLAREKCPASETRLLLLLPAV